MRYCVSCHDLCRNQAESTSTKRAFFMENRSKERNRNFSNQYFNAIIQDKTSQKLESLLQKVDLCPGPSFPSALIGNPVSSIQRVKDPRLRGNDGVGYSERGSYQLAILII